MVAALAGGVWQGAASMVAFGVGGACGWPWPVAVAAHQPPAAVARSLGLRTAGALLAGVSLWALWMDMVHVPSQWCR
jgi:sulfite exporter TauE/SafE